MKKHYMFIPLLFLVFFLGVGVGCLSNGQPLEADASSGSSVEMNARIGTLDQLPKPVFDDWLGAYQFSENESTRMVIGYNLEIYKERDAYFAKLLVGTRYTLLGARATVQGDSEQISIVFDQYLPDGGTWNQFQKGDVLFNLIEFEGGTFTEWVKLAPTYQTAFQKYTKED